MRYKPRKPDPSSSRVDAIRPSTIPVLRAAQMRPRIVAEVLGITAASWALPVDAAAAKVRCA